MNAVLVVFWTLFGAVLLWIAAGFVSMLIGTRRRDEPGSGMPRHESEEPGASVQGGNELSSDVGGYDSGGDSGGGGF